MNSLFIFRLDLRLKDNTGLIECVKNSKNVAGKSMIRKAEDPLEVIMSYAETIGKLGKRVKN